MSLEALMQDYSEDDAEAWSPWRTREALAALCRAMSIGALIGAAGAAVTSSTDGIGVATVDGRVSVTGRAR